MIEFGHGAKLFITQWRQRYFVVGNEVTVSFREACNVCLLIFSFLFRYLFRVFISFPSFTPFFFYPFPSFMPSIRPFPSFSLSLPRSFSSAIFAYNTLQNTVTGK
jgi:hypothetical protein